MPAAPRYDVHPSVAMVQKWTDELPGKTGRTLDEWAGLVRTWNLPAAAARARLKAAYSRDAE